MNKFRYLTHFISPVFFIPPENKRFSDVIRGYRNRAVKLNGFFRLNKGISRWITARQSQSIKTMQRNIS